MRVPLLIITLLAHAMIVHVAGPDAVDQTNPPQAQSGPQDRRSTGADARPGETLSEQLEPGRRRNSTPIEYRPADAAGASAGTRSRYYDCHTAAGYPGGNQRGR